jgi:hypothetical protein
MKWKEEKQYFKMRLLNYHTYPAINLEKEIRNRNYKTIEMGIERQT